MFPMDTKAQRLVCENVAPSGTVLPSLHINPFKAKCHGPEMDKI